MIIPVTTPPAPSPHARELSEQLVLFVNSYKQMNPDLTSLEVEQALMLTRDELSAGKGISISVKLALVLLIMGVAGLVSFFLMNNASTPSVNPQVMLMLIIGLGIVSIGIAVMAAARR